MQVLIASGVYRDPCVVLDAMKSKLKQHCVSDGGPVSWRDLTFAIMWLSEGLENAMELLDIQNKTNY